MRYSALLVASDGDWTVDYHCDTVEEVQEKLADQGSRWYFYPFHAVIVDHYLTRESNRIVSCAPPFEYMKGRSIKTFTELIAKIPEHELMAILEG